MTARELLHEFTSRGVRLTANNSRLRVDAPPGGTLTGTDRTALTKHKADLLILLKDLGATPDETSQNRGESGVSSDGIGENGEVSSDVNPWNLPPDLYELYEERAAIRHFDGNVPLAEAEAL